jgi:hypothetical protein
MGYAMSNARNFSSFSNDDASLTPANDYSSVKKAQQQQQQQQLLPVSSVAMINTSLPNYTNSNKISNVIVNNNPSQQQHQHASQSFDSFEQPTTANFNNNPNVAINYNSLVFDLLDLVNTAYAQWVLFLFYFYF